jgi:hypothetical protein
VDRSAARATTCRRRSTSAPRACTGRPVNVRGRPLVAPCACVGGRVDLVAQRADERLRRRDDASAVAGRSVESVVEVHAGATGQLPGEPGHQQRSGVLSGPAGGDGGVAAGELGGVDGGTEVPQCQVIGPPSRRQPPPASPGRASRPPRSDTLAECGSRVPPWPPPDRPPPGCVDCSPRRLRFGGYTPSSPESHSSPPWPHRSPWRCGHCSPRSPVACVLRPRWAELRQPAR